MRVPRQWSGADLEKALSVLGYEETRQTGSHVRLTTQMHGVHHVTVKVEDTGADRPRPEADRQRRSTPIVASLLNVGRSTLYRALNS